MAGDPEIYVSAAVGDNQRIVALLAEGEDIDRRDESGHTALMGAAGTHLSTLELLLDRGADVDAVNDHGWSAVALAYYRESAGAVQRLVDAGADTSLRVTSGELAEPDLCQQARRDDRPAMVEVLC